MSSKTHVNTAKPRHIHAHQHPFLLSYNLPLCCECGMPQTCRGGLCVVQPVLRSPGYDLPAGVQPGRSPLGHTRPSEPAALPPPGVCLHSCRCSEKHAEVNMHVTNF